MKSSLKVLKMPYFASELAEEDMGGMGRNYKEIEPVFKRPGQYYDRIMHRCWIEDGKRAWLVVDEGKMFIYELNLLNHQPLRKTEREAMQVLVHSKIAPYLRDVLHMDDSWFASREAYRGARKIVMRYLK